VLARRKTFDLPLAKHFSAVKLRSFYLLFYIFPACAYGSVIFYLSSLSSFPEEMPSFWGFDKIIHFIEYYVFGYLIFRCFAGWEGGSFPRRHSILWTVGIGILYALTDEWHQSFVPGRDPSFWDAFFDTLGVSFAALTFKGIRAQLGMIKCAENWLERRMRR
jgi:VanZ family protein